MQHLKLFLQIIIKPISMILNCIYIKNIIYFFKLKSAIKNNKYLFISCIFIGIGDFINFPYETNTRVKLQT
jgi:hypothetical protein